LADGFQRRRLKCEKLTDDRQQGQKFNSCLENMGVYQWQWHKTSTKEENRRRKKCILLQVFKKPVLPD
jgi:hypothetical protein